MVFLPSWLSWIPLTFYEIHEIVRDGDERKMKISLTWDLTSNSIFLCVCCIYYWRFDTAYWKVKDSWGWECVYIGIPHYTPRSVQYWLWYKITDNSLCSLSVFWKVTQPSLVGQVTWLYAELVSVGTCTLSLFPGGPFTWVPPPCPATDSGETDENPASTNSYLILCPDFLLIVVAHQAANRLGTVALSAGPDNRESFKW